MSIRIRPSFVRIGNQCKWSVFWLACDHLVDMGHSDRLIFFVTVLAHSYGAERFEDGASQINKSDMFYGDDGDISDGDLEHMDEITMKNVQFVKMTEGDVVLLDNYKSMHGRNVFDGTRKHGVAWFEGWSGEEEMKSKAQQPTEEAVESTKAFFMA